MMEVTVGSQLSCGNQSQRCGNRIGEQSSCDSGFRGDLRSACGYVTQRSALRGSCGESETGTGHCGSGSGDSCRALKFASGIVQMVHPLCFALHIVEGHARVTLGDTMGERLRIVLAMELGNGFVQPSLELARGILKMEFRTGKTSSHRALVHSCPVLASASTRLNRLELLGVTIHQIPIALTQRILLRAAHLA